MIHDEKTTEIELPPKKLSGTSKAISTETKSAPTPSPVSKTQAISIPTTSPIKERLEWIQQLDLSEPWVIRLIAVLTILVLSMLVL